MKQWFFCIFYGIILIIGIIKTFKTNNFSVYIGFNGLGAYASVNHLHLHLHIKPDFQLPKYEFIQSLGEICSGLELVSINLLQCLLFKMEPFENYVSHNSLNKLKFLKIIF